MTPDVCPVCGWEYLETEHVPENPDPEYGPDAPGTEYIHRWVSTGNGRAAIAGCTVYENGKTDAWEPPDDDSG
jgi:rubredoxin